MKQIKKKSIAMYLTFAVLIIFLTGAECTIGGCSVTFNDYTGKAVNVKAAGDSASYWKASDTVTLEGAIVTLIPMDENGSYTTTTGTITSTVGADGSFSFLSLGPNKYKLTGTKDGWTFVPRYIEVSGDYYVFPDLMAYPTDNAGLITIVTSWQDVNIDVDAILTYGEDNDSATVNPWATAYQDPATGFRTKIDWDHTGATTGIMLDRDIASATVGNPKTDASIPRVETISFYSDAWLDDGDVAYLYIDTYFDEELGVPETQYGTGVDYQSLTGEEGLYASAYAQVDVMFGTIHYGTWVLPWNTSEDTIKVLRIDYNTASADAITGDLDFMIASAGNSDAQYGGIKAINVEE